jgi:hypothetical protein
MAALVLDCLVVMSYPNSREHRRHEPVQISTASAHFRFSSSVLAGMKIGYFLSCEEYAPGELVEQARLAEQAGFRGSVDLGPFPSVE